MSNRAETKKLDYNSKGILQCQRWCCISAIASVNDQAKKQAMGSLVLSWYESHHMKFVNRISPRTARQQKHR